MSLVERWSARGTKLRNRWQARMSTRGRKATGFVSRPEPRTIGQFARGKQLLAGNYLFAGYFVEAPGTSLWDIDPPDPEFSDALHGFAWLDDLAAVGDRDARALAQSWTWEWIERFGRGGGPGWCPDIAGRRMIRWINHALFLLVGQEKDRSDAFFGLLAQQTHFISRRWKAAQPGIARFEALTGLIYAGLALTGMEAHVGPARAALGRECKASIQPDGGIPTRNPEELLEVFTLLTWAASALSESGQMADADHVGAIERIAPTLRILRHSDGALARFHGGGRGAEGRLDHALAASGVRAVAREGQAMGYARLSAGRTSVIIDAAPPPAHKHSARAHASTLAFELTSGRRPLIVSCGAGDSFGPQWQRAGRATASHSTLAVEGYSSSRLGVPGFAGRGTGELLVERPGSVTLERITEDHGSAVLMSHDGYVPTHGLTHIRRLDLSADGRALMGEETLAALDADDRRRFTAALDAGGLKGVRFAVRFHLHPDVDARLDMNGSAVSLALRSGEIWVFRHDGVPELSLDISVYLEKGRLRPRAAQQIVLSGVVLEYASQLTWTLAKAGETPIAVRDIEADELPMPAFGDDAGHGRRD